MESYTRLSDGGRSPETEPAFTPPFSSEYDQHRSVLTRLRTWWASHVRGTPAKQYPVSGYLTLIPLSGTVPRLPQCVIACIEPVSQAANARPVSAADERLKPRRTKLLVAGLVSTGPSDFFLIASCPAQSSKTA